MKWKFIFPLLCCGIIMIHGCDFSEINKVHDNATRQFADQHFKTAIALIELHHIRNGHYPVYLDELEFLGEWDKMIFNSLEYQRLEDGYELNVHNNISGEEVQLNYPDRFWKGLGLKRTNVKE